MKFNSAFKGLMTRCTRENNPHLEYSEIFDQKKLQHFEIDKR